MSNRYDCKAANGRKSQMLMDCDGCGRTATESDGMCRDRKAKVWYPTQWTLLDGDVLMCPNCDRAR